MLYQRANQIGTMCYVRPTMASYSRRFSSIDLPLHVPETVNIPSSLKFLGYEDRSDYFNYN